MLMNETSETTEVKTPRRKRRDKGALCGKALYKEIAKDSKYYQYEVEDILQSYFRVVTKNLLNGVPVKVLHLGSIVPFESKARNLYNMHTKEIGVLSSRLTAKFVPSKYLLRQLNPSSTEYNTEEEDAEDLLDSESEE